MRADRHRWLLAGLVDLPATIALVASGAHFAGFAEARGLSASARGQLRRRLEAGVGQPPLEAFDLPLFAPDLPLAALVVHDPATTRRFAGRREPRSPRPGRVPSS